MTSINQIEKLQKNLFNELDYKEKLEFCRKLSKEKYKHYLFISEEGKVSLNKDKHNSIDNMQVFLNANKDVSEEVANASLSVVGDFEALKEKYVEEFEVAFSFYGRLNSKNELLINYFVYFLESFLGAYTEEPSELLFYVLQDVAKGTISSFNKAKNDIDNYITNISEIDKDKELKEEIQQIDKRLEKKYSKYTSLVDEIIQLEKPEGVNNNG